MSKRQTQSRVNQTQEERRKMIDQVFDMYDADHNGVIETNELQSLLTALGRKTSKADINKFLEIVDTDKSGTINKNEFMEAMEEIYSVPQDKVSEVVEAFTIFDKDHDGKISLAEMKNILLRYGNDFKEEEVEEIFKLIDTNNDGSLSYAEFAEIWKFQ